ncbi:MAG: hypothetical protein KAI24_21175 [Planctomycetes bacterium]|nr:hypothetical protein [Planctomycetota bacterium]
MRPPRSLYVRLLLALAFAVVALVSLAVVVEALDDGPKRTLRAQPGGPRAARRSGPAASVHEFSPPQPGHRAAPGFEVDALAGTLAVARRTSSLPPDVAPVVEILADGSLALRRPRPLASGPAGSAGRSRGGHGAGVVLPSDRLEDLGPAARGALAGLLQRWFPARPIPTDRLHAVDLELSGEALTQLLRWVP